MKNENNNTYEVSADNLEFRKVLHGFDPKEVAECINKMTRSVQDASKNYEMRMAEKNQELALVNRERDKLKEKCFALEKALSESAAKMRILEEKLRAAEETAETGAVQPVIPEPPEEPEIRKEPEEDRNEELMREANERIAELTGDVKEKEKLLAGCLDKVAALESQIVTREEQIAACEEQIAVLNEQIGSRDTLRLDYENALSRIEIQKAEVSGLVQQCEQMTDDLKTVREKLVRAEEEKQNLKTELSRLHVENSVLAEANEKYKKDYSDIRAETKAKAYDAAEKLSAQEDAFNREKLKLKKQLQLQSYHIGQADLALEELKKQLAQIAGAFTEES